MQIQLAYTEALHYNFCMTTAVLSKKSGKARKVRSRKREYTHPRTQKVLLNAFTFDMARLIARKNKEPMKNVLDRMLAIAEAVKGTQSASLAK